jgi:hypothetical protein
VEGCSPGVSFTAGVSGLSMIGAGGTVAVAAKTGARQAVAEKINTATREPME